MWWLPRERLSIQRRWKTWSLSNAICRCSKAWAWESDHIIDLVTFWNITTIDHKNSFLFDSLSRRIGCWWVICSHILHFCWLILCICANLSLVYFWIRSGETELGKIPACSRFLFVGRRPLLFQLSTTYPFNSALESKNLLKIQNQTKYRKCTCCCRCRSEFSRFFWLL